MAFQLLFVTFLAATASAHHTGCNDPKAEISDFQRTSSKFQAFRDQCPGDAQLTDIFGVGSTTRDRLVANGLEKAIDVVEAYVALDCNQEAFIEQLVSFDIRSNGARVVLISVDHHVKTVGPRCSRDCTGPVRDFDSRAPEQGSSRKFLSFRDECAGDKPTNAIFGIGSSSAATLSASYVTKAVQLVDAYEHLRCNKQQFVDWLVSAGMQEDAATFATISIDHYYKVRGAECAKNCVADPVEIAEEQMSSRRFQRFRDNCPEENQSTKTVFGIGRSSRDMLSENGIRSVDQLVSTYYNLRCKRSYFVNLLVGYGLQEDAANLAFNSVDHFFKTSGDMCLEL